MAAITLYAGSAVLLHHAHVKLASVLLPYFIFSDLFWLFDIYR